MLFKPEDLMTESYDPIQEAADILNESVYLDESESLLSPVAIPVVENARIGACVVAFDDVERLAEDHGVDYIDAMVGIAEANSIDMDHLAVSVPEWKIIANPEVVNELSNVVVSPISKNNPVYQFCEACVDLALQEEDEGYIDTFTNVIFEDIMQEADIQAFKAAKAKLARIKSQKNSYSSKEAYKAAVKKAEEEIATAKNTKLGDSDVFQQHDEKESDRRYNAEMRAMGLDPNKKYTSEQLERAKKHTMKRSERETKRNQNEELANKMADEREKKQGKKDDAVVPAETKSLLDRVKGAAKWPVEKISQAISSLKTKYQDLKTKIQNTAPENRSIFQKFMNLIMSAIDKLSNLLSSKKSEGAA